MFKDRCIYTVLYTNLKNYDKKESNSEYRLNFLNYCVQSYRKNNPNVFVKVDIIDEPMANAAEMYFDKMRRIKELNYLYDVLWVDNDTICLQNIESIFENRKMCAVSWCEWIESMNVINGGVVYYPKRYLYNNWDWFVSEWIRLLSDLYIEKINIFGFDEFFGVHEQIPITNLLLKQMDDECDYTNYNLNFNKQNLLQSNMLLDWEYNYNPIMMHFRYYGVGDFIKDGAFSTIMNKKIIHLNSSMRVSDIWSGTNLSLDIGNVAKYIIDNLIGYMHDSALLRSRCDELNISNKNVTFTVNDRDEYLFTNNTLGIYKLYKILNEHDCIYESAGLLIPGCFLAENWVNLEVKKILLKNVYSGEETFIEKPK